MKFSVLFAVGANIRANSAVRPRAFTERPYKYDFLSVGKTCFMEGTPCPSFFVHAIRRLYIILFLNQNLEYNCYSIPMG